MPGRNYVNSVGIPYAYQGQEKDAETNLLNFELRQYDARLGRWYNPDPYGQHHSPYLAMGNNPVSVIDPDGGYDNSSGDDGLSQFNSFCQHSYINGDMDRAINEQQAFGLLKHEYNEYKAEHYNNGNWGSYEEATLHTTYGEQTNTTIFVVDPSKKIDRPQSGSDVPRRSFTINPDLKRFYESLGPPYQGGYLKSSSKYDYSGNGGNWNKMKDDISYIKNGFDIHPFGENMVRRFMSILERDLNAESNQENVEAVDDAFTAITPLLSLRNIRNAKLAGKVHPTTGVPFTSDGFPDFSKNLYRGGTNTVIIKPTGNRASDFVAANKAAGYLTTPKGYTWHHHQTRGVMQLVDTKAHSLTGHTGGFSLW